MSDFLSLLEKRRSIRKYKASSPEKDKLDSVIKAALLSPSSRGINTCSFIVVDEKSLLEKLSVCRPHGGKFLSSAGAAVVVIADTSLSDVWVENASIAAMNIQLAAESKGLGSCWVQVRNREHSPGISADEYIRNLLSIPEEWAVECIISIGYPDESHPNLELTDKDYERVRKNSFNHDYIK